MPLRLPPLLLLLAGIAFAGGVASGCGPKRGARASAGRLHRYQLALTAEFSPVDLAALPPDVAPALEPAVYALEATLSLADARRFSDGSIGRLLTIEAAEFSLQRPGGLVPAGESGLAGRAAELRVFGDGELLDVALLEHLAGPGRYGEVLDLLLPALTPSPPGISLGERAPRAMRWPVRAGPLRLQEALLATWTLAEETADTWGFTYEGPWTTRGWQELGGERLPVTVEGMGEGEVRLRKAGGALERHRFGWKRTVTARYPSGVVLAQQQRFAGELELVETAIIGAPPEAEAGDLPRYIDAAQVRRALEAGAWQPCVPPGAPDAEAQVAFSVQPSGELAEIRISGSAPPEVAACWQAALASLRAPPHNEAPLAARWGLAIRGGRAVPWPLVELDRRELLPLLVFTPPDLPPLQRAALRGALGLPAEE